MGTKIEEPMNRSEKQGWSGEGEGEREGERERERERESVCVRTHAHARHSVMFDSATPWT